MLSESRKISAVGWAYEDTLANGVTGETIPIESLNGGQVTGTVIAGAGTGKLQFTTSLPSKVALGTEVWQDWAAGEVTGTVSEAIYGPISGVRGVSVSGEVTIEVMV